TRIIAEQKLQPLRWRGLGCVDAARPQQHQAVDPLRSLQCHPQRARTAQRIAERMHLVDAEGIEKSEHGSGEIAERIGPIDAFCRSPIAWQVRNDQPEMAGERRNVAAEIGRARRPGSPAMEQQKRGSLADLRQPNLPTGDLNVGAALQTLERKWFHSIVLPDVAPLLKSFFS